MRVCPLHKSSLDVILNYIVVVFGFVVVVVVLTVSGLLIKYWT
jgi:hypothetical protein